MITFGSNWNKRDRRQVTSHTKPTFNFNPRSHFICLAILAEPTPTIPKLPNNKKNAVERAKTNSLCKYTMQCKFLKKKIWLVANGGRNPIEIVINTRVKTGQSRSGATNTGADDADDLMTAVFLYH